MTENEARQKWCPFARVPPPNGPRGYSYNRLRDSTIAEQASCIASDCMAWRWDCQSVDRVSAEVVDKPAAHHETCHGYCGLAGKP